MQVISRQSFQTDVFLDTLSYIDILHTKIRHTFTRQQKPVHTFKKENRIYVGPNQLAHFISVLDQSEGKIYQSTSCLLVNIEFF